MITTDSTKLLGRDIEYIFNYCVDVAKAGDDEVLFTFWGCMFIVTKLSSWNEDMRDSISDAVANQTREVIYL